MMAPQFPSTGWQTGIARGPPPQHPLQAVRPLPRLASQPQANGFSNYTTRPLAPLVSPLQKSPKEGLSYFAGQILW